MSWNSFKSITLALAIAAACGYAQPNTAPVFTFSYRTPGQSTPVFVSPNGTITAPDTLVGSASTITITVQNATAGSATAGVAVTGQAFSTAAASIALPSAAATSFDVKFAPSGSGLTFGTLTIQGSAATESFVYTFYLAGSGTAPQLQASYSVPGGNQTALPSGGTLAFPATAVGTTTSATVTIVNRGNGPGSVDAISLTGGFQLSGAPLLPAAIAPGANVQFSVSFTPGSTAAVSGQLHVRWDGESQDRVFAITGSGLTASWQYSATSSGTTVSVAPNGTIQAAQTSLPASSKFTVQISNSGNQAGQISNIQVSGAAYSLADAPPLPAKVQQGDSVAITITFTPQGPGNNPGTLTIDSARFTLAGTGVGSSIQSSFTLGSSVTPLTPNATITFPNTSVGANSKGTIQIQNAGNSAGTVNAISITGAGFTIPDAPPLPLTLAPSQAATFSIVFTPSAVGSQSGTLQIDGAAFALRGVGNQPPSLGTITISGPGAQTTAMQQSSVRISLGQPYPLALSGTLTLSFTSSAFANDPSVQFASGGTTVAFTIPANSSDAVFGSQGNSALFQTGSVAGTIIFTAALAAASVDVTPSPAPSMSVVVPAAAPQLRAVQIGTRTSSSFELLISGYAPTRSISQLQLQFTPKAGVNLGTTSLSSSVDQAFTAWYQSAASASFGSQFTISVIVNVTGDPSAVQSVTASLSNSLGSSNSVTASLQ
ncbi:MAG: choice-of-anchor D domain-containing protein [Acidobacteriia bacterium]|nr:choice-of-anchor D domain-containing protein [Terriglobia bacterium]